ncbi:MAG: PilZ domain-containing protein [Pseudomonadota bacterium]|nr:PilZ domain-containing protein [Pseudomonadota bacterium]
MDAWGGYWQPEPASDYAPVEAEFSTAPDPAPQPRAVERIEVEFGAALRQRGATGVSVQIMDLSTNGFRVATHLEIPKGTDVWLRLPGLEPCHARVAWSRGHFLGCEFMRPLHPAVLDMIVRNASR